MDERAQRVAWRDRMGNRVALVTAGVAVGATALAGVVGVAISASADSSAGTESSTSESSTSDNSTSDNSTSDSSTTGQDDTDSGLAADQAPSRGGGSAHVGSGGS
ncbi:hypothetical protein [Actinokineospora sp. NBRC 105648]|uniref:hypothetical protein n=1 Tax=Actinokineospora sp. NBRC 105648 TaxID=3032206 RepID=UPI0024A12344|nr:hypothetical protein [Actinokineospora sp. NBRC 105648]GLZ39465.1 hypothetical protein Acsp05_30890 [Actinokineospora sp. NBRC 105648]